MECLLSIFFFFITAALSSCKEQVKAPMLLIGATLPRTGTSSIQLALERLGHKIFHTNNILEGSVIDILSRFAQAELDGKDEQVTFEVADELVQELSRLGYTGTIDFPLAALYEELMKAYPNAKVLLTVRQDDSGGSIDKWAQSALQIAFTSTTFAFKRPFCWIPIVKKLQMVIYWMFTMRAEIPIEEYFPAGIPVGQEGAGPAVSLATAMATYYRYVEQVKKRVPSNRLVIYSVKDGWEPLCEHFLRPGHTCPKDEPFPFVNKRGSGFVQYLIHFYTAVHYAWPLLFVLILWLAYGCTAMVVRAVTGNATSSTI